MLSNLLLEKTLECPLDCKEIKPVHPKGNQPWIFTGRTNAEAEAPILWSPDTKSWLIRKDPDAGKDWRQEKKATTEDEMVGWHHQVNGHEFEQALGGGDGQGSLVCFISWGSQRVKQESATEQHTSVNYLIPRFINCPSTSCSKTAKCNICPLTVYSEYF